MRKQKRCMMAIMLLFCLILDTNCYSGTDCSPGNNCLDCQLQYICGKCKSMHKCCPKYCQSCSNSTNCYTCQKGFNVTKTQFNWRICQNVDPQIDPNRNRTDPTKCITGYLNRVLNFCQLCSTPNCKACGSRDSQCLTCEPGFQLKDNNCIEIKRQQNSKNDNGMNDPAHLIPRKNDLNLNFQNPTTNISNPKTPQEQNDYYIFFFVLGTTLGFCLACILMKIYFCIKKKCQNLARRFRNRKANKVEKKKLIQTEKPQKQQNNFTVTQTPHINDQQKQFAEIKQDNNESIITQKDDNQTEIELNSNNVSSKVNKRRKKKQIITQDKD